MSFPIPVSILTGFLGSGKTSLLNRLLKDPLLKDTAVIINEFGEVGLDHLLVEQADDGIIELADGCLCCTVRGALVDTLGDLVERVQTGKLSLKHVIIETTGLADPAPVIQSIMMHPVMVQAFRLDGVLTTVDAVNGMATLDNHEEAVKQVAMADRLIITKSDLIESRAEHDLLVSRLTRLNPGARIVDAPSGEAGVAALFDCGLYNPATKTLDVARWLNDEAFRDREAERDGIDGHDHDHHHDHSHDHGHHHHDVNRHDKSIRSFSVVHDKPISQTALQMFLDLLGSVHGERLLRMKGVVALEDDPARPMVIHAVQKLMHPPVRLAGWPGDDHRTRLVIIGKDLPEAYVRDLFAAFAGQPVIDRPDRAALEDNPLAIAGKTF